MFKLQLIATFILLNVFLSFSQLNIDSISSINYQSVHNTFLNDIWGYTDELGNEYGLIGAEKGVSVVDLSTPSAPNEVFWFSGAQSTWRDLKTFGDFAYVTTEASSGLLIIDLSPLPSSPITSTSYYHGPIGQEWTSAHNLFIDENGYAYIFGADRGNKGVIILDVFTDPMNPIEVGVFDNWYTHDGFVRNDTMFLGHIYEGFFSMVDVSDKANPVLLGTQNTPSTFSHNVWASGNGQYAFTTDEVSGGYIGAYDVTDPTNIVELDRIQSSPDYGAVIPHNTHVKGNHIITSYYSDGVVVHDITHPYNLIEVGNYDTYPSQNGHYDGCWGVYPFFSSGIIIASDRSEGLFVLSPNYVQGAYLEGIITNSITNALLDGVSISISSTVVEDNTNSIGFYATGTAVPGTYNVTYAKVGFFPQTLSVNLSTGVITTQDVQLVPIPPYNLTVRVFEEGTTNPIIGASIRLEASLIAHSGVSNGLGEENFTLFYQESYEVIVGKWGKLTHCHSQVIDNSTGTIDVYLKKGYYDDFSFDFGWSASGTAVTGMWERAKPIGVNGISAPSFDDTGDCGGFAFVTGNGSQPQPDADDVDNGTANLTSPIFDLTSYTDPYLFYSRWFYNEYGPALIDDTLRILISNGTDVVELDKIGKDPSTWGMWTEKSFRISDFITLTSTMQLFVKTSDFDPDINITEAGFDRFRIGESSELGLVEKSNELVIYPNPSSGIFNVEGGQGSQSYQILSWSGEVVQEGELNTTESEIDLRSVINGVYFLRINNRVFKVIKN